MHVQLGLNGVTVPLMIVSIKRELWIEPAYLDKIVKLNYIVQAIQLK